MIGCVLRICYSFAFVSFPFAQRNTISLRTGPSSRVVSRTRQFGNGLFGVTFLFMVVKLTVDPSPLFSKLYFQVIRLNIFFSSSTSFRSLTPNLESYSSVSFLFSLNLTPQMLNFSFSTVAFSPSHIHCDSPESS